MSISKKRKLTPLSLSCLAEMFEKRLINYIVEQVDTKLSFENFSLQKDGTIFLLKQIFGEDLSEKIISYDKLMWMFSIHLEKWNLCERLKKVLDQYFPYEEENDQDDKNIFIGMTLQKHFPDRVISYFYENRAEKANVLLKAKELKKALWKPRLKKLILKETLPHIMGRIRHEMNNYWLTIMFLNREISLTSKDVTYVCEGMDLNKMFIICSPDQNEVFQVSVKYYQNDFIQLVTGFPNSYCSEKCSRFVVFEELKKILCFFDTSNLFLPTEVQFLCLMYFVSPLSFHSSMLKTSKVKGCDKEHFLYLPFSLTSLFYLPLCEKQKK